MLSNNSPYGNYRTRKFSDIYPDRTEFINDYNQIYAGTMKDDDLAMTWNLIVSRYANSHVANTDENQFKMKLVTTVFSYGPTYFKKLEIQKKLREMSEDDIIKGSTAIYNHSSNPSTAPSTNALEELLTIDDQNTQKFKRSKLEAYNILWGMLATDITTDYINKFKRLFIAIAQPDSPLWYADENNEEDEDGN